jgi:hypothetical protein
VDVPACPAAAWTGVPARPYLLLQAWMYRPVPLLRPPALGRVYRPDCPPRHSWELNPRRPANRVAAPAAAGDVPTPGGPDLPPPPKKHGFKQCCGSGIRCLFDPWIQDPGWEKIGIRDEQPGSYFRELKKQFFGLKYLNSLMRSRDGKKSSSS